MGRSKYGVIARLVWDGGDEVRIPEEMGTPAPNQMQGTPLERLSELAARVCYDSLGKGRSSPDLHKHLLDVGHHSVYEHAQVTIELAMAVLGRVFINRPGVWVSVERGDACRVTLNPRVILDWNIWSKASDVDDAIGRDRAVGDALHHQMCPLMPAVLGVRAPRGVDQSHSSRVRVVEPRHDEEKWVSLFFAGSRGFSHECVRHKFRTGVSQRSTRFVDEDGSPWVDHPLVQEFLVAEDVQKQVKDSLLERIDATKAWAKSAYAVVSVELHKWLISKGVDKLTARKQARAAARGYLGNALYTELIFSASVGQWKRMLRLRCSVPADAEIRAVFAEALKELKRSRYAEDFEAFELRPSADGLGEIAVERR
jgi:thymidylate synthase ThyX